MNAYMNGSAAFNIDNTKPKFNVLDGYLDVPAQAYAVKTSSSNFFCLLKMLIFINLLLSHI